ncbi:MAG: phosphate--acyl-ACP acyltransferase, partial [Ginsengibacter sp.]
MKIALDMMGGDFAPQEAVNGVALYLASNQDDVKLLLIGDQEQIKPLLSQKNIVSDRIEIVHAAEVIGMHEHPTKALKEKQQSSISLGFKLLSEENADAFIGAGNTGAMMVGALHSIKAIEGVSRPTIGAYLP